MKENDFAGRLLHLRKTLGLSQGEIARQIGAGRTTICGYELGKRYPSESIIILICIQFNVNREWLIHGKGDMFNALPETILDELMEEYNLNEDDRDFVKKFVELTPEKRKILMDFFSM